MNDKRKSVRKTQNKIYGSDERKKSSQGFSGNLILLILCIIVLVLFILVIFDSCNDNKDINKETTSTAEISGNDVQNSATPKPKEPVWYEQAEVQDVQEVEYTPPAGVEFPYYIKVNRATCCVTVYGIDEKGEYSIPIKAFACSVGKDKPETDEIEQTILGEYQMSQNLGAWWCRMVDDTYGQFAYRIKDGYMFHSVPCYEMERDSLETEEFNKLGQPASLGCIRLCVRDAKWICDNCPVGTTTLIFDDAGVPDPLGKPDTIKLPIGHEWSGWDPTDPHESNPWRNSSAKIEASDITVNIGETINLLEGVKAYDTCGNDITSKMTWYGKYTPDIAGTYTVTFKVTDAIGSKAQKTIRIVVKGTGNSGAEQGQNAKAVIAANVADEITSEFAALVNCANGEIMLNKKASAKMYPASITKAVALLVIVENITDMDAKYTIKQETYDSVRERDASVSHFPIGQPILAEDLIYGSFLLSGADATITLAENIAGSETAFVALMNKKAVDIGMKNTNFVNVTGLHEENQYSTCADLALFLREALKNEQFREIFTTKEYSLRSVANHPKGDKITGSMFTFLGGKTPSDDLRIAGGKTGYTVPAGLCLASLAVSAKTGNEYILITGKAPGNYWETESPNHTEDALTVYGAIVEA